MLKDKRHDHRDEIKAGIRHEARQTIRESIFGN